MAKPPKVVIPGLNRGDGIPPGYVLGRRRGSGKGPAELLDLHQIKAIGIATGFALTASTSLVQSIAHSETVSLSTAVSSSLSSNASKITSLSTAVSTVISGSISAVNSAVSSLSNAIGGGTGQSTSLSQISSSLSSEISSRASADTSLSTAISTVDSGQTASLSQISSSLSGEISSRSSAVTSLSTAVSTVISGSISTVNSRIDSLSTAGGGGGGPDPGQSTSLSQISSSLSGEISSRASAVTSLSTAVSTVDSNQSTSLSQLSSSLSSEISSMASGDTSLSTVISGSTSTVNSRIDSLSTAVGGGGSSFSPFYDSGVLAITAPVLANFTLANSSGATATLTSLHSRGIILNLSSSASAIASAMTAVVSQTAFTASAFINPNWKQTSNSFIGIGVQDSTGKVDGFGYRNASTTAGAIGAISTHFTFTSSLTVNTTSNGTYQYALSAPHWLRVQLTGGNLVAYISLDGENWIQTFSVGATSYLGSTLSSVGIVVENNASGLPIIIPIMSFNNTTP